MKQIRGMFFPDGDQHFALQMTVGQMVDGRGTYQYRKYRAARAHCTDFRHAVDVGAHVGLWTRVMLLDFEAVSSFEPLPAHIECFKANIGEPENNRLFPCAISDKPGRLSIHMPHDNTGHAHVLKGGHEVEAMPLDLFGLNDVDLLKIDVEGWEYQVVTGAEQTIKTNRPVVVVEQKPDNAERYGRRRTDAVELLRSWGMRDAEVISGDHIMVW